MSDEHFIHSEVTKTSTKPTFWQINFGHVLTLVLMICGFGGTAYNTITAINKFDARLAAVEKTSALLEARMQLMDQQGTIASQKGLIEDTALSRSTERRVTKVEVGLSEMIPKVERIDVNLQWLIKEKEKL